MTYLYARPFVNSLVALSLVFTPNLAFAREDAATAREKIKDGPPAPPILPPDSPLGSFGGSDEGPRKPRRSNKKPRLDDPTKPGVSKVQLSTYEDANPSLVKKAATKTKDAVTAANAKYQDMRARNADRVDKSRQKVAGQFYDRARDPKIPIPSNRALDIPRFTPSPYGPVAVARPKATPAQPTLGTDGQGFESIPRFARDGGKLLKASNFSILQQYFGPEQRIEMGKRLHDVITGKRAMVDFKRVELAGGAATTAKVMADLPNQFLSIGMALGAAAAFNLLYDHPRDPLFWQKYMEEMTDPVGWLGIAGFSLAMAPVTSLLSTDLIQRGGFAAQAPIFVSALALGTLVQNGVAAFANDGDVKACLGLQPMIDGYKNALGQGGGRFNDRKDPAACDRVAAKVASGELSIDIFMKSVPSMAAVAISGTLTYTILYGVQKYIPVEKILSAVGLTVGVTPLGLALRGAYSLGMTMLFLKMNEAPTEYFTKLRNDWSLAEFGKEGPLYAKTIKRAQSDLFATWERARASGWQEPTNFVGKDVCKDERRAGSPYYECSKPRELDFQGAFATFAITQRQWREQQLRPVLNTWREWLEKVSTYRNTYELSKDFYKSAIEKLVYAKLNPKAAANDPKTFSLANLEVKTSSAWPNFLRSIVARLDYYPSEDGVFGHVSTPNLSERLVTLMACGPPATGSAAGGVWSTVTNLAGQYITGNYTPRQMIVDANGKKIEFYPPRITKSTDGTADSVCEQQYAMSLKRSPLDFIWMRLDTAAPSTLDKIEVQANGKRYVGLVDYIKDNVREDIITPEGFSNFDAWWAAYVTKQDDALNDKLQHEYSTYMNKALPDALKNQDYYWCESSAVNQTPIGRYVARIGGMNSPCSPDNTHRLAYGPVNALRDQTVLYFAMMADLYVSNSRLMMKNSDRHGAARAENQVIVPAQEAVAAYDAFATGMVNLTDVAQIEALETTMNEKVAAFLKIVLPAGVDSVTQDGQPLLISLPATPVKIKTTGKIEVIPARPAFQLVWMRQLGAGLITTLAEWQGFVKVSSMEK